MNSFFFAPFVRAIAWKKTLIAFAAIFFLFVVLGLCFVTQPAAYDYHLNLCARYVDRVCYSDTSVILIFMARVGGCALLAVLTVSGGIHKAALLIPIAVLGYRGYTLGGSLYILFSVYGMTGAVIVFLAYLPVHLLIDAILLFGCVNSVESAMCSRIGDPFKLLRLFLFLLFWIAAVCAAECVLLLAFFHPIGTVL